jgi:hypothetical protein
LLSDSEKDLSINFILAHGLVKPPTARAHISDVLRTLGCRYIFWDTGYSLFFAALSAAAVFALYLTAPEQFRYATAVAIAPLLFLLTTVFAETAERFGGLYELKQTCRYTIQQISALRALCYSLAGAVFTALIALVKARGVYEFFSLFALCLAALFVCAAMMLAFMRLSRNIWLYTGFAVVWVFASAALALSQEDVWESVLAGVPLLLSAIVALASVAVFAWQIAGMLRGEEYAAA